MKAPFISLLIAVPCLHLFLRSGYAQTLPPTTINYQGRVSVAGVPIEGTGYFKFLLYAPDKRLWSNDDSHTGSEALAAYEPSGNVSVGVAGGLFSADLGFGGMPAITSSVLFDGSSNVRSEVYLRIWFSTSSTGPFVKLSPDRRLSSVPFALVAGTVTKGAITNDKVAPGAITSDKLFGGTLNTTNLSTALQADSLNPPGSVIAFAGATAPPGWQKCDGSSHSTTDPVYTRLFSVLLYAYGGSGASFSVPDLRGRVPAGQDSLLDGSLANRLTANGSSIAGGQLGAVGGSESRTLTAAQSGVPVHDHSHMLALAGHTHEAGSLTAMVHATSSGLTIKRNTTLGQWQGDVRWNVASFTGGGFTADYGASVSGTSGGSSSQDTAGPNTPQDAAQAHSVTQPTMILNYIIKL